MHKISESQWSLLFTPAGGDLGRPAVGRTAQSNRRGDGTRERSPRKRNVKGNDLSDGGSDDKDLMRSPHRYEDESRSSGVSSARRRGIVPLLTKSVTRPRGPCWPGAPCRGIYTNYIFTCYRCCVATKLLVDVDIVYIQTGSSSDLSVNKLRWESQRLLRGIDDPPEEILGTEATSHISSEIAASSVGELQGEMEMLKELMLSREENENLRNETATLRAENESLREAKLKLEAEIDTLRTSVETVTRGLWQCIDHAHTLSECLRA